MKKLLLIISVLLVLAILIPSMVMADTGRQNWQLNNTPSGTNYIMAKYPGPNGDQAKSSIILGINTSKIWIADQISQGVTFPTEGAWGITLYTDKWTDADTKCTAVVGDWDGSNFTPISVDVNPFSYAAGKNNTWVMKYDVMLADFTVPAGQYLAVKITNGASVSHRIYTGAGNSTLASPQTDPGYPTPEVASIVLLGLGMAGLGTFVVIRRQKAVSKV
jgi:hypothetical protein